MSTHEIQNAGRLKRKSEGQIRADKIRELNAMYRQTRGEDWVEHIPSFLKFEHLLHPSDPRFKVPTYDVLNEFCDWAGLSTTHLAAHAGWPGSQQFRYLLGPTSAAKGRELLPQAWYMLLLSFGLVPHETIVREMPRPSTDSRKDGHFLTANWCWIDDDYRKLKVTATMDGKPAFEQVLTVEFDSGSVFIDDQDMVEGFPWSWGKDNVIEGLVLGFLKDREPMIGKFIRFFKPEYRSENIRLYPSALISGE